MSSRRKMAQMHPTGHAKPGLPPLLAVDWRRGLGEGREGGEGTLPPRELTLLTLQDGGTLPEEKREG